LLLLRIYAECGRLLVSAASAAVVAVVVLGRLAALAALMGTNKGDAAVKVVEAWGEPADARAPPLSSPRGRRADAPRRL